LTNTDLDILAAKIAEKIQPVAPRWLKTAEAVKYSGFGKTKIKRLAMEGKIKGYPDPDSKRGDWYFDKESIDEHHLSQFHALDKQVLDLLKAFE